MKGFLIKLVKHPFFITFLLAIVVSCVILYGTLKWLDGYTLHNQAVIVPDVKGLKINEAEAFVKSNRLRYNIIDSVFSNSVPPGTVVEIVPAAGSKVKEGRILFLTVNALTSRMGEIPEVEDLSSRQAYALLTGRGFESVDIEYVNGVYKDLAIGVEWRNRLLQKGEMIPLTSRLVLKVSNGETDPFMLDSLSGNVPDNSAIDLDNEPIQQLNSEEETWF